MVSGQCWAMTCSMRESLSGVAIKRGSTWAGAHTTRSRRQAGRPPLAEFLEQHVFAEVAGSTCEPADAGRKGAEQFIRAYRAGLPTEITAGQAIADTAED